MQVLQADEAVQAMTDQFYLMDRAAEAGKHAVDSKMLRSALSKYQKGAFKNGEFSMRCIILLFRESSLRCSRGLRDVCTL